MPIEIDQPVVQPAVAAKTYSEIWNRSLNIVIGGCNGEPVGLSATFGLVGRDGDGVGDFLPDFNRTLNIDDLYTAAATDPELANLLGQVLAKLVSMAKAAGTLDIAPPANDGAPV